MRRRDGEDTDGTRRDARAIVQPSALATHVFRVVRDTPKRRVTTRQKAINPTNENDAMRRRARDRARQSIRGRERTAMRPRVSRRLAASAVVTAARATVLRSARLLSFAGAATREQRAVEVIANMIDASAFL